MSINILGGLLKGAPLSVPKGMLIRPTAILLKRRLFDFYQDLSEVIFVDLCAGSGAMGIEALSRGATQIFLNENNRKVAMILNQNKVKIECINNNFKNKVELYSLSAPIFLKQFKAIYTHYSIDQKENTVLFLDPPYENKNVYLDVFEILKEEEWFFGQLWIESNRHKGFSAEYLKNLGLLPHKIFEQGDNFIFVANFPQNFAILK